MFRFKLIFIAALLLVLNSAFAGKTPETTISGTIKGAENQWVYIKTFANNSYISIDSTQVNKKGKFKLSFPTHQPNFYSFYLSDNEYLLLVLDSSNTKVKIDAEALNMSQNYTIDGSKDSKLIQDFIGTFYDYKKHSDSLNMMLYSNKVDNSQKEQIKKELLSADSKFILDRNNFIKENSESLAVLTVLSYLKPSEDLEWYKLIEKGMENKFPNSNYHLAVKTEVEQIEYQLQLQEQQQKEEEERIKNSQIGSIAPELNFKSPEGKVITLESLRGNYVLVDFWASWCRPCRGENPNVVRLYNEYHDKGFTVYSVSLDNSKDRWVNAIQQDGLIWPNHVSDLKQWQSAAVQIYNFRGIPYTVLLDPEGRIIAKNLRGEKLERKLKELFGE